MTIKAPDQLQTAPTTNTIPNNFFESNEFKQWLNLARSSNPKHQNQLDSLAQKLSNNEQAEAIQILLSLAEVADLGKFTQRCLVELGESALKPIQEAMRSQIKFLFAKQSLLKATSQIGGNLAHEIITEALDDSSIGVQKTAKELLKKNN
jgi:hypothetical protein